jgi:FkbM family methyltransferase
VPVLWIEADKELSERLSKKGLNVINTVISDKKGKALYYRTNKKACDSLLKPKANLTWGKNLIPMGTEMVKTTPLKDIQASYNYNMLVMDIQGAELLALKGADLNKIDYIQAEVHVVETYENCTKRKQLIKYLKDFKEVEIRLLKKGWGDAFFIRKNIE